MGIPGALLSYCAPILRLVKPSVLASYLTLSFEILPSVSGFRPADGAFWSIDEYSPKVAKTEAHLQATLRPNLADEETLRALPAEGKPGGQVLVQVRLRACVSVCLKRYNVCAVHKNMAIHWLSFCTPRRVGGAACGDGCPDQES